MSFSIAIVGVSGLVGKAFLKLLENENIAITKLRLFGSENSAGEFVEFNNKKYEIEKIRPSCFDDVDFLFLFCPSNVSKNCIKIAKSSRCVIIDNSALKRMEKSVPLVVPEINGFLAKGQKLIANPNCTTAICALPLYKINTIYKISSINFCTYQAVSGSGRMGLIELIKTRTSNSNDLYAYNITKTCIPKIGSSSKFGYTVEEWKMVNETKKIFDNDELKISATCVRVPIENCHSIVVYVKFKRKFSISKIKKILSNQKGIVLLNDLKNDIYPVATIGNGKSEVFVGRIRRCLGEDNALLLYILSDNLLRGAAYNALMIMRYLIENK